MRATKYIQAAGWLWLALIAMLMLATARPERVAVVQLVRELGHAALTTTHPLRWAGILILGALLLCSLVSVVVVAEWVRGRSGAGRGRAVRHE